MPADTIGVVPRSARGRIDTTATEEEAKVRNAKISSLRARFVGCSGGRKTRGLSTLLGEDRSEVWKILRCRVYAGQVGRDVGEEPVIRCSR